MKKLFLLLVLVLAVTYIAKPTTVTDVPESSHIICLDFDDHDMPELVNL